MARLYLFICNYHRNTYFVPVGSINTGTDVYKYGEQSIYAVKSEGRVIKDVVTSLLEFVINKDRYIYSEVYCIIHATDISVIAVEDRYITEQEFNNYFIVNNPGFSNSIKNIPYTVIVFSHGWGDLRYFIARNNSDHACTENMQYLDNIINNLPNPLIFNTALPEDTESNESTSIKIPKMGEENENGSSCTISNSIYLNKKNLETESFFFLIDLSSFKEIKFDILIDEIANFHLCGCDVELYKEFYEQNRNSTINDSSHLIPIFDNIRFENVKPIIIHYNKSLNDLKKSPKIDRRVSYLDSSIWLRFVSDKDSCEVTKQELEKYFLLNLYKTANANECLEFYARLVKNSFLRPLNKHSSHDSHLSPFLFHSESTMKEESVKLCKNFFKEKHEGLRWRVLLVDDHSTKEQANGKAEDESNFSIISKCKIIRNALKDIFSFYCYSQEQCKSHCDLSSLNCAEEVCSGEDDKKSRKIEIELDCCDKVDDALIKMSCRRYDIIFLDYLLGWNNEKTERKYSYELLSKIKDNESDEPSNKIKGPFNQFWFFFISAFPNAVLERLSEQGMQFNTDYWHLARGACPTTTPELFKFNLLSFMKRQIEVMSKLPNVKPLTNPDEILVLIYEDNKEKPISSRASDYFDSLLKMRANYHILEKDYTYNNTKELGSPLVHSLFPETMSYNTAFWEHLMNLVYLTAFGTIRQWHEMWQEYQLVKSKLNPKTTDLIEEYIVAFKNGTYI